MHSRDTCFSHKSTGLPGARGLDMQCGAAAPLTLLADATIKTMKPTTWKTAPAGYSNGRTRHEGICKIPKLKNNIFYCGKLCGRRFTHAPAAIAHTRKCANQNIHRDARSVSALVQALKKKALAATQNQKTQAQTTRPLSAITYNTNTNTNANNTAVKIRL